jgi:hypothetical protein
MSDIWINLRNKVDGRNVESYLYEVLRLNYVWNMYFQDCKIVPESELEERLLKSWRLAVDEFVPYLQKLKDQLGNGLLYALYHGNSHHLLLKAAAQKT